jgi:hypothetical protein
MSELSDERRRFHRVVTDKPVRIRYGEAQHSGTVLDISLRGLLLEQQGDWQPVIGGQVHADIQLDAQLPGIRMDGEIRHIDGRRVGLRCVGMDLDSASMLRRMVELNLQDDSLLERDLAQLISA